jgi:hypothetical protein
MPDLLKTVQDNIAIITVHLDTHVIRSSFLKIRSFQRNKIDRGKVPKREIGGSRVEKVVRRRDSNEATFGRRKARRRRYHGRAKGRTRVRGPWSGLMLLRTRGTRDRRRRYLSGRI